MPWCPKCKTEYREGITVCPDCGSQIVDRLPEDMICIAALSEETALGLLAYYEYLGIDYSILEFDKESGKYRVLVPESKSDAVQKPTEEYFSKLSSDKDTGRKFPETEVNSVRTSGHSKKEQLEDAKSSSYSFLTVGIAGIVCVILILAGVIPFPFAFASKVLMLGVMSLLFLGFTGLGIHDARRTGRLREEAIREEDETQEILKWFTSTYTKSDIDRDLDLEDSNEINYYKRTNHIREMIRSHLPTGKKFPEDLLETLYEHYYEA